MSTNAGATQFRGQSAIKQLESAKQASAYQKEWFKQIQTRAAQGEPCALVSADAPQEIFRAMDIPYIVNQWWSSVISSRQQAPRYMNLRTERGYSRDLCAYCSLPLACSFDPDPTTAPWGGMPKISLVVGETLCDSQVKIYGLWAQEQGIPFYPFERTVVVEPSAVDWWDKSRREWESLYEPQRIDLMEEELKEFVKFLEIHTGKSFNETKFKQVMALVNEQEEYSAKTRDLIAATVPAPLSITDSIPSVMIPQWQRGTEWGVHAAKTFYEEVLDLVAHGEAACPNEKIRLMWIGVGLWFNTSFYQYFQEKYGAVFVWSFYLGLAADGYARYGDDPMRTLAARYVSLTDGLHTPPWNAAWYVNEARRNQIKGAVVLAPAGGCAGREPYFTIKGLEHAGIPVFVIESDNVDSRKWNDEEMKQQFSEFIEARIEGRS